MNTEKKPFMINRKTVAFIVLLFFCMVISSCQKKSEARTSSADTANQYDSKEELYIFQSADRDNNILYMVNVSTGADAEFTYSGRTEVLTFEGESTVVDSLQCGELVKVVYNTKDNILNHVHVAGDGWKVETTGKYLTRVPDIGGIKVENSTYKLNGNYIIYSNNEKIDMDNIVEDDRVTVRGVGNVVYTITVTAGHGILRLKNSTPYLGGWIELGKTISVIKEGMVLDVPEGDYNAILTRHGCKGEIIVSITRDKETIIDCQELKETKTSTGIVAFSVMPEEADIYINGSRLSSREPVELTYGKYYLVIKAPGYTTYGATMIVGSLHADINVSLNKATPSQSSSASTTSGTGSGSSGSSSSRSTGSSSSSVMGSSARQSMIDSVMDTFNNSIWSMMSN